MITVAISDPPKKDKGAEVAMETTLSEKPSGGTSSVLMPPPRMIPTSVYVMSVDVYFCVRDEC